MPEDLPTPKKSLKQLEKENKKDDEKIEIAIYLFFGIINQNIIVYFNYDGKCVSYGAITGEKDATAFIRTGTFKLSKGDFVVVYSDGFNNFLQNDCFIRNLLNFDKRKFENYINKLSQSNYEKYGKEKTLVIFRN